MTKLGLPKSVRKFIRLEKARIRAQFLDLKKEEELIKELYDRILGRANKEQKTENKEQEAKNKITLISSKVVKKTKINKIKTKNNL